MEQGFFITGTDTNVGKTWTTAALMRYFQNQGKSVIGLKPVASGCTVQNGMLTNDDALLLQKQATVSLDYHAINAFAYEQPISPHLAGKNKPANIDVIVDGFHALQNQAQVILVEGAGGWYSPLNDTQDNCDLAGALGLPVIIVVAIRLGCINHAKLTYQAVARSGVNCAGWIAACLNPNELSIEENIDTLKKQLKIPLLAVLPYTETPNFEVLASSFSVQLC